jgi:nitroimidazol reductase NimA-like FMN-containing flavoprotein (pyridoxamine 5'-phosphate oxidase superfamily)
MKNGTVVAADATRTNVVFRDLTDQEIEALLKRHHVGRLAFTYRDRVDVEPIHFVYADGAVYGRTEPGSKLTALLRHPWVALEVDEVDGLFDWRSVVVKGTAYLVYQGSAPVLTDRYDRAVAALRTLMPDALTEDDPVAARSVLFRLHIHEKHGRAAKPSHETVLQ